MVDWEIPRECWRDMVNQFSRLHRGKFASVSVVDPTRGACSLTKDQPLIGLIHERPGREDESITVVWGGAGGGNFSHSVRRPKRMALSEGLDTDSEELEIESPDGATLLIHAGQTGETIPPDAAMESVHVGGA